MSLAPDVKQQEVLVGALAARREALNRAEVKASVVVGGGFVLASAALLIAAPPASLAVDPVAALACFVALIIASRVEFDVGSGWCTPSQIAFVPLLFTMPPSLVPLVAVAAELLAKAPDVARGERSLGRLLRSLSGAGWYSVGPAIVLLLAPPGSPSEVTVAVAVAVVVSELLGDLAAYAVGERLARRASLREHLDDWWVSAVDAALTPLGLLVLWSMDEHPWAPLALLPLLGVLGVFARERRARIASLNELNAAYRGTALVLGDVVEADDGYTGEHCRDVVALAIDVGQRLGLDAERMRNLEFGALLHDVGKVAIPKEIINKPGKLDADEWAIIKTHTVEGQRMLDRVGGFMSEVGLVVRSHHERWDGGGYPDALAGTDIAIEARIVAACDTWNAMTTDRSYRAALPEAVAVAELRECAGTQFDPDVVEAVLAVVAPGIEVAPAPAALAKVA